LETLRAAWKVSWLPLVAILRSAAAPGEVKINPADGQRYVWIPPGRFEMGCSPGEPCPAQEMPRHGVTLTKGFWMGQTEVTLGAHRRFAHATGRPAPPAPSFAQNERHPVVNVAWDDAAAYCGWAGGRLPTEAEWEYAARAGTTQAYSGELNVIAWYNANSGGHTHEVGQKEPNAFGLYDMLGNAWEWVGDWFHGKYYAAFPTEARDPPGPPSGRSRVLRGGSWDSYAIFLRVSYRFSLEPGYRNSYVGFRCVREVIP